MSGPDPAPPPAREGEPPVIFDEPWQAQAFALAVQLQAAGVFTWPEWTAALGRQLAREAGAGGGYYEHWVAALEQLVGARGLVAGAELTRRRAEWARAYRETPHGAPVELGRP